MRPYRAISSIGKLEYEDRWTMIYGSQIVEIQYSTRRTKFLHLLSCWNPRLLTTQREVTIVIAKVIPKTVKTARRAFP